MLVSLRTSRLKIRPLRLEDANFILALLNGEGWLKFIGDRKVKSLDDARKYIKRIQEKPHFSYSVMELLDSQKAIGVVSLLLRDGEEIPDFGFALLPEYEGQGYAFEASSSYLSIVKKSFERVCAITLPGNVKSVTLLRKLGFNYLETRRKGEEVLAYYIKLKNH